MLKPTVPDLMGFQLKNGMAVAWVTRALRRNVFAVYIALRDVSPKIWRPVELTAGSSLVLERQGVVCDELFSHPAAQHRGCAKGDFGFRNARGNALAEFTKRLPCVNGIQ